MDSEKQGGPEKPSEEHVRHEVKEDADTGTKRTYECTFCKRGFTNAQALGGHMNIHRKDQPNYKRKQVTGSSVTIKGEEPISSEPEKSHLVCEAQGNYRMYFQPPVPSLTKPCHNCQGSDFLVTSSQTFGMIDDSWGEQLSLPIRSTHSEDKNRENMGVSKEDEVDLELRLGRHP